MENQLVKRKLKKVDFLFLGLMAAIAFGCFLWYRFPTQGQGDQLEITVDGKTYGNYALGENAEIPIQTNGKTTNIVKVENGSALMWSAECPDRLCVHHKEIRYVGETIVCLPNKVVVTVTGEEEPQFDSVAK